MPEPHFDGVLTDDERSPAGFEKVDGVAAVLVNPNTGRVVITGKLRENPAAHNCDIRGCGSVEHKIAEFQVDRELFEPVRGVREGDTQ